MALKRKHVKLPRSVGYNKTHNLCYLQKTYKIAHAATRRIRPYVRISHVSIYSTNLDWTWTPKVNII